MSLKQSASMQIKETNSSRRICPEKKCFIKTTKTVKFDCVLVDGFHSSYTFVSLKKPGKCEYRRASGR